MFTMFCHFTFYHFFCYRKSAVIGVQPLHTSWNRKQKTRMEQKLMKVYEKELKDETKKQKEVSHSHSVSLHLGVQMHTCSKFNAED